MKKVKHTAICSHCGKEMMRLSLRKALTRLARGAYFWYSCCGSKKEVGCGHALVVKNISKHKNQAQQKRNTHGVKNIALGRKSKGSNES